VFRILDILVTDPDPDPDPAPDPALFRSDFQDANKKLFFCSLLSEGTFISFFILNR
jgi:hypothetical protein